MSPSLPSRRTILTGVLSVGAAALAAPFAARSAMGGTQAAGGAEAAGGAAGDLALARRLPSPPAGTAQRALLFGFRPVDPLVMVGEDGRVTGLEAEIILAALGDTYAVTPYLGPNSRLNQALFRAAVDGMAPAIGLERTQFALTQSYLTYRNVVMTLPGSGLRLESMADLAGHPMLAFQRARQALGPDFAAVAAASPGYREEGQQHRQIRALLHGRVPIIIGDRRILYHHLRKVREEEGHDHSVVEHDLFPPIHYSAAFRDPGAAADFDRGLSAMKADGRYAALLNRYGEV